jgi:hypothetical protein
MARDDETRLFRPDDLLSRDELAADAEGARSPAAVERDEDLDAAHMWISKDDGLLVRGVKPHSAQKSTLVSRGIDVGERTDVDIVHGDANDPGHLKRVADLLNPRALIVAYLDPARPQDLRWTTVEYLATKFGFVDLIINLPLNSLMRAILGAYRGGGRGPGAAGRFLNHARPHDLLVPRVDRPNTAATIGAIRRHYDEQLMALGVQATGTAEHQLSRGQSVLRHPAHLASRARSRPVEQDEPSASRSAAIASPGRRRRPARRARLITGSVRVAKQSHRSAESA